MLMLDIKRKQPNPFIPAMLTGTYGFYHYIQLSMTLTLTMGHTVSTKQNLLPSFSHNTFQLNGMKFSVLMKQFKLKIRRQLLNETS